MNQKRAGFGLLMFLSLGLLLSACGGSAASEAKTTPGAPTSTAVSHTSSKSAQSKPTTVVNYAQQYLADLGPANAADKTFESALSAWSNGANPSPGQTQGFVTSFVSVLQTTQSKLTAQSWPAADVGDIHALVAGIAAIQGDIAGLPSLNMLNESSWVTQFQRDSAVEQSAADTVRHDLGLPPIPTSNG